MPTVTEWTLAVISAVLHFSFIIAILYTLKRFYNHRYSQPLQKRSPLLVYLMNICFIIYFVHHIADKFAYIYGELDWNIEPILKGEDIGYPRIISLFSCVCYVFSLHGIAIMWIARSWVICFNCNYGLEVQKSEWTVHLNHGYSNTLWFVKHRHDYGSNHVIYPIAITWYIIDALLQPLLLLVFPDIWLIYNPASLLIKFIILVIIWYKIPSFNDIFGIKKEMQWMYRAAGIALLIHIVGSVLFMILGHNLCVYMLTTFMLGMMTAIIALILNGFIFHHPNYKHLVSSTLESTMPSSSNGSAGQKLSLLQVLENKQLIESFFVHLIKEFSMELLLALIEFKQFHDLMTNDHEFMAIIQNVIPQNSGHSRAPQNILSRIHLADEIPNSNIVHVNHHREENSNNVKRYLGIARDLFDKYISTKAEFEVNLSYKCRQKITIFIQEHSDLLGVEALSEKEQLELYILFDTASKQMYRLLLSSNERYITANWQRLSVTN